MTVPPTRPCIYHITHLDNLAAIAAQGGLLSDSAIAAKGGPSAAIGISKLKQKRTTLPVSCYPGDHVSDYVPFYFCPRSVMLFVLSRGNYADLTYRGGQEPIVHLEADLYTVVHWAKGAGIRWAFSLSNAAAYYTEFRNDLSQLGELNWPAISSNSFRDPAIKEPKQAEFLLRDSFPWTLVNRIGICSKPMYNRVVSAISGAGHRPLVEVRQDWYF